MKKVILALAVISVSFAACNSGETTTEAPKVDSPAVVAPKVDSPAVVAPKVDSPAMAAPKVDTAKKADAKKK